MNDLTELETLFALEADDDLKTKMCMNHLVAMGRNIGGDFNLTGQLDEGQYLIVSVKMTNDKSVHDAAMEQ